MDEYRRDRGERSRSRSPRHSRSSTTRHRHRHKGHRDPDSIRQPHPVAKTRPYSARELSKRDYDTFKPMFALYLDVQKGIILEDLEISEAKGRWKSFLSRWNHGELAEGWYDPTTFQKAVDSAKEAALYPAEQAQRRPSPASETQTRQQPKFDDASSEDEYGPAPAQPIKAALGRSGPAIPSLQDLEYKREIAEEDAMEAREDLRHERRMNRKTEKERLEELVPRAQAGTRERQLEKRKDAATSNKAFATAKEGGDIVEVPESDLMGGEEGIEGYKKKKQEFERKKNEREIRKDEIARARREEREERAREFREREENTMKGLIELARKRYG